MHGCFMHHAWQHMILQYEHADVLVNAHLQHWKTQKCSRIAIFHDIKHKKTEYEKVYWILIPVNVHVSFETCQKPVLLMVILVNDAEWYECLIVCEL